MDDEDRPPVLAHLRFEADRGSFTGLGLRERFERIHQVNLWGAPTSTSGLGSESAATIVLKRELPGLLRRLGVTSLLDAPCGDASWILDTALEVEYAGIDIVASLVHGLAERAANETGYRFAVADITSDPLPVMDAILCRDCLVHLSFDNIRRAVGNFQRSGARYLMTTTFTEWHVNRDIEDGDWRPLNLERPPFQWPAPIHIMNEACAEAGGGYRDKSLAVWRMADLTV